MANSTLRMPVKYAKNQYFFFIFFKWYKHLDSLALYSKVLLKSSCKCLLLHAYATSGRMLLHGVIDMSIDINRWIYHKSILVRALSFKLYKQINVCFTLFFGTIMVTKYTNFSLDTNNLFSSRSYYTKGYIFLSIG